MTGEDLPFQCRCGLVRGKLRIAAPSDGARVVCYCDDCQAFAYFLNAEDDFLDAQGGSDIFQTTPARFHIEAGAHLLACVQLTGKGVLRWYTDCCKTPIANTAKSRNLPFVGSFVRNYNLARRSAALGPVTARVFTKFARGDLGEVKSANMISLMTGFARRMLGARLSGRHKQNPFFEKETGAPVATPTVLTREARAEIDARMAAEKMAQA